MNEKRKRITIEVSQETHQNLQVVAASCNRANQRAGSFTSHGNLTVPGLLAMLAEDAAMTNSRPGSWEGSMMQQVLTSHGY